MSKRLPGGIREFRVLGGPAHFMKVPLPERENVYRHPFHDENGVITTTVVYRIVPVLRGPGGGSIEFLAEPDRDLDDLVAMAREWVI